MSVSSPPTQQQQQRLTLAKPALVLRMILPRSFTHDPAILESALHGLVIDKRHPVALELVGTSEQRQILVRATSDEALSHARGQLLARFPQAEFRQLSAEEDPLRLQAHEAVSAFELKPGAAPYLPLQEIDTDTRAQGGGDPLLGLLAALGQGPEGTRTIAQIALVPAENTWSRRYQRKSIEHALEPERQQNQLNMAALRASGGAGPSAPTIILLGVVLAAFFLYRHFQSRIPAFEQAGLLDLLHGRLPHLTQTQALFFWGSLAAVFAAAVTLFIIYDQVRRRLFQRPLYDMRQVSRKTSSMAYHARIRLYCIGPGEPSHLSTRAELAGNWGRYLRGAIAARWRQISQAVAAGFQRARQQPLSQTGQAYWRAARKAWRSASLKRGFHRTVASCQRTRTACRVAWQQWQAPSRWQREQAHRRETILCGVNAAYRQFNLPGGAYFVAKRLPEGAAVRLLTPRESLLDWRCGWYRRIGASRLLLTVREACGMWGLLHPAVLAEHPLLEQRRARSLPLPPTLLQVSVEAIREWHARAAQPKAADPHAHTREKKYACPLVGTCVHAGHELPFAWPPGFLTQHTLIGGKSGEGKTSCLEHLIYLAAQEGPFIAMGPHGDFIEHVLRLIPPDRVDDVVLIDFSDPDFSVALNPLDVLLGRGRDKTVGDMLKTLSHIWSNSWGSRMEAACEKALLTLYEHNRYLVKMNAQDGPAQQHTLLDVLPVLTSLSYCNALLQHNPDPFLKRWWEKYYEPLGDYMRLERIDPVLTKMAKFESYIARRVLGQSRSTINLSEIIAGKKILLINLSKSVIGEDAAKLLGATLLSLISIALEEQGARAEAARVHLPIFVDEFQFFQGVDYGALAELRKFGAAFFLATQSMDYLYKLDPLLLPTVLANVRQHIIFHMSARDATTLHKELGVEEEDILNLDPYMCYVKLSYGGRRQPTFSLNMAHPPEGQPAYVQRIRDRSRAYSRPAGRVDEEVAQHEKESDAAAPLNRPKRAANTSEAREADATTQAGSAKGRQQKSRQAAAAPVSTAAASAPAAGSPSSSIQVLAASSDTHSPDQAPPSKYRGRKAEALRRQQGAEASHPPRGSVKAMDFSEEYLRATGTPLAPLEGGDEDDRAS
jgi:hypothetical protein